VIRSGVDRGDLVHANGKVGGGGQDPVHGCSVQAFEEGELGWVGGGGLLERTNVFDHNMRVTNDLAIRVQLLGGCKVVLFGVHEEAGLHPLNGELDGKVRVCLDCAKVRREHEFGTGHVGGGGD
jgi:hypothetical protein